MVRLGKPHFSYDEHDEFVIIVVGKVVFMMSGLRESNESACIHLVIEYLVFHPECSRILKLRDFLRKGFNSPGVTRDELAFIEA